jgi:purine-nucleoside phosphorylase
MSLPVLAMSVITDECDPDNLQSINIEEIIMTAAKAEVHLTSLFEKFLIEL